MVQKYIGHILMAAALTVLLSSTAKIGIALLSDTNINIDNLVHHSIDDDDEDMDDLRSNEPQLYDGPVLPIHQRKLALEDNGGGGIDALPKLMTYARKLNENKLVSKKCGVVVYQHHIPGDGGAALDEWMTKVIVESNDNVSFIANNNSGEKKRPYREVVQEQLDKIGPEDWKIINLSYYNDGTSVFDTLRSLRNTIEKGKNCQFITSIIFSDPLDHSTKYTKYRFANSRFAKCNGGCSMTDFTERIMLEVTNNSWVGQLDALLFNSKDTTMMEMKDKVKKGLSLLKQNFDIVLIDGQGNFAEQILRITGWNGDPSEMRKASISDGGLVYSKDLVSQFGKMSKVNGDQDFIDAVNHIYHNSLNFLMLQ